MAKNLIIVESPAKSKTLGKFLGKDFEVLATYGHIRDLEPKTGSVDPAHQFAMKYQIIAKSAQQVEKIANAIKKAKALFLATDPDREGEAIAWHLVETLKERDLIQEKPIYRVVFHEITKQAIQSAVENPRTISMDLVHAQQARRALDYLVGFNLSPLLWKKIRRGLSAGRVQSAALRLIVERELEIEKFEPKEYWSILADLKKDKSPIQARLIQYETEKLTQFSITNEDQATAIKADLLKTADGKLQVVKVEKKQRKRNPAPPFITSTLQQEAVRKLGFTARKTMIVAQQLYEGIEIGGDSVGLITYMRTDSVNLATEAIDGIRSCIEKRYGKDLLPKEARIYKTKAKNAQEAHEAIRPTEAKRTPELIKQYLNKDQYRLYELIWQRTVASQMMHATIDTVSVDLACGEKHLFRATGSTIRDPGFLTVYQEDQDDAKRSDTETILPPLQEGEIVPLLDISANQHFTEPPPRFTEASLVKTLEEYGIGRPSTYATIIYTLQQRDYVVLDKKRFTPTDLGRVVNRFLSTYFNRYVDYGFTADLEDQLDEVSRGEKDWIPLLETFWAPFITLVQETDKNVKRSEVTAEPIDEACPRCEKQLMIRLGRSGLFIGCSAYPECEYTRNLHESDEQSAEPEKISGRSCPKCQSELIIKQGPYGKFIGCSSYPDCRFIEPLEKPADTGVECPQCKQGTMLERRTRKGKQFFSCSRFPDCKYAVWNKPIDKACPQCQWPMLTEKVGKRIGTKHICPQESCKYSESIKS